MSGHTHDDIDWADRLAQLRMADALDAGALAPVARRLIGELPETSERPVVIDVGCGAGGMSVLFARELARRAGGTIVLVDATPVLLAEAQRAVSAAVAEASSDTEASSAKVDVVGAPADLADGGLPGRVPAADLVWASGVVHHVADQQAALRTLATVLRPGGLLAIAEGGQDMRCLPWDLGVGRPGLEHRLQAERAEWFAAMRAGIPGSVSMPYGWPVALRRAGLAEAGTFGALIDHPMPGSARLCEYVVHRVGWLAGAAGDRLAADDREAVAALLDPDGPDFLGSREDLYLFGAKIIHCGRKP